MAKSEVAVKEDSLPTFIQQNLDADAGLGNSTSSQDNTLPFLAILQSNSPQCEENKPEYIEGAQKGMLFNTATSQLWSGKEGVEVVPFAFQKKMVEWVPRNKGGGYVGTYEMDDPIVKRAQPRMIEGKQRGLMLPESGNDLVETAYTFVLLPGVGMPLVIGATSTALRPMRDWMALRNSILINGKTAPAFSHRYLCRTVHQENESGSWYTWKITDAGWVDQATYERAREFAQAASRGDMVVGRPTEDTVHQSQEVDDSIPV